MSKDDYTISIVDRKYCLNLLNRYHYLRKTQKSFRSGINYGLFLNDKLVGVCIYASPIGPQTLKGIFGCNVDNYKQTSIIELSRLVLDPIIQNSEHNIASWFVSRTIKLIKKNFDYSLILSYADDNYHRGIIYSATNFKYYGLTDKKSDFFVKQPDGNFVKHSWGSTKGIDGEWRSRSRKHRFLYNLNKNVDKDVIWEIIKW